MIFILLSKVSFDFFEYLSEILSCTTYWYIAVDILALLAIKQ